jgi:hypothetical protein
MNGKKNEIIKIENYYTTVDRSKRLYSRTKQQLETRYRTIKGNKINKDKVD